MERDFFSYLVVVLLVICCTIELNYHIYSRIKWPEMFRHLVEQMVNELSLSGHEGKI